MQATQEFKENTNPVSPEPLIKEQELFKEVDQNIMEYK